MKLSTTCIVALFVIDLHSCEKKSAINTDEYVKTKVEFLSQGEIVSVDLYELSMPVRKTTYWQESALAAEALKSHKLIFSDVSNLWKDSSDADFDFSKVKKIYFGVVIKNVLNKKYFMTYEGIYNTPNGLYVLVNGFEDRAWWFKSENETLSSILNNSAMNEY
jgi:hypothetical protein